MVYNDVIVNMGASSFLVPKYKCEKNIYLVVIEHNEVAVVNLVFQFYARQCRLYNLYRSYVMACC